MAVERKALNNCSRVFEEGTNAAYFVMLLGTILQATRDAKYKVNCPPKRIV